MSKRKGYKLELETAALGGKHGKRVPRSGAFGTTLGIDRLAGDAQWKFPWMRDAIVIECKHGYEKESKNKYCPTCGKALDSKGKAKAERDQKSMTIYREWFDKLITQSKSLDFLPAWSMKFKFTSEDSGMSKFIVMPFSTMETFIKEAENLYLELEELKNEQKK